MLGAGTTGTAELDASAGTGQAQVLTGKVDVRGHSAGRSHGFFVLTLLTASVAVCWIPGKTFYTWHIFSHDVPLLYGQIAVGLLHHLQTLLDPVYFVVALQDLRAELAHALGFA